MRSGFRFLLNLGDRVACAAGIQTGKRIRNRREDGGFAHPRVCASGEGGTRRRLLRLLVPEDRKSDQENGDNPEHDIFSAIFFLGFGHKRSTAYMKPWFKCCSDFPYKQRAYCLSAFEFDPAFT